MQKSFYCSSFSISFWIESCRSSSFPCFRVPGIYWDVTLYSSRSQMLSYINIIVSCICQYFLWPCSWSCMSLDLDIFHNFNEMFPIMIFSIRYLNGQRKSFTAYTSMDLYSIPFLVTVVCGILSPFFVSTKVLSTHTMSIENLPFW